METSNIASHGENRMVAVLKIAALILGAFAVNLPLGYLRDNYERFTFGWYFYIHISIPAIIYLRIKASLSWKVVPLTVAGAILGQVIGGRIRHGRQRDG
jgi:hypothetical protein